MVRITNKNNSPINSFKGSKKEHSHLLCQVTVLFLYCKKSEKFATVSDLNNILENAAEWPGKNTP